MSKRTLQGVATAATLGTGMILGSLLLGPTSAEPLIDDPEPSGSSATEPQAQPEGSLVADETPNTDCAMPFPVIEIRPGLDHENPGVFVATAVSGETAGEVTPTDELTELPAISTIAEASFSDDQTAADCIFASCSVLAVDGELPEGAPTPPFGLPATGISVTEKDGKIVVADEDGTVLLETDASENGTFGFEIEDGSVRQLDGADLPSLSGFEFQDGGVSTAGCLPLE